MIDLEALGGAATGGLAAAAIEAPTGHAGQHQPLCADCGTETIGRFCHNCGNTAHVHRTLLHLGEELLHGVMHFDSRTWRTLPLLAFRPGKLTREWCLGKRMRYVSPLAIFLFTVFVMFMALSYLPHPKATVAEQQVARAARIARERTNVANLQAALAAAKTDAARQEAQGDLKDAQNELAEAIQDQGKLAATGKVGDWKADLAEEARSGKLKINMGDATLNEHIREKLENPELALYKLEQTFYKFAFLLVPISIPFVAVLFLWKRGFTLYDHGVFVLYSLTFMSLLIMMVATAGRISNGLGGAAFALVPFIVPAHMFFQLKGAYGLGAFSALWRTFFLLIFSSVALALFVTAVVWMDLA